MAYHGIESYRLFGSQYHLHTEATDWNEQQVLLAQARAVQKLRQPANIIAQFTKEHRCSRISARITYLYVWLLLFY